MKLRPKKWDQFQHYKTRNPPWIKLHHRLLDDYQFHCLPVASRALAPCLWLLASEVENGIIDASTENLAFRLRQDVQELESAIGFLVSAGFFEYLDVDASSTIACGKHGSTLETETETETETKKAIVRSREKRIYSDGFVLFWKAWPKSERKQRRPKCFEIWKRKKLESKAEQIVAHVERLKGSESWQSGFDPMPTTYLNQESWDGADLETPLRGEKHWSESWSGIVAKGAELGLQQQEGEAAPYFKSRVIEAANDEDHDGRWMATTESIRAKGQRMNFAELPGEQPAAYLYRIVEELKRRAVLAKPQS